MKILRFEGYSDDTFGEVESFRDDYDNCANGTAIEYLRWTVTTQTQKRRRPSEGSTARVISGAG